MVSFKKVFALLAFIQSGMAAETPQVIYDYHPIFCPLYKENKPYIAMREFDTDNGSYYVVVDPFNFKTEIERADNFFTRKIPTASGPSPYLKWEEDIANLPYMKALIEHTSAPYPNQNYGVKFAQSSPHEKEGCYLTVDLCPSRRKFEEGFFSRLVDISKETNKPISLALCVSGRWIFERRDEFLWLKDKGDKGLLNITWVNHSYFHPYYHDVKFEQNFELHDFHRPHFVNGLLSVEKLLIKNNINFSPFFRFPGLYSDESLIMEIRSLGYIPLGSDAWVAKGEAIHNGGIVLVHGNGNEPEGIELLMPQLERLKFLKLKDIFK